MIYFAHEFGKKNIIILLYFNRVEKSTERKHLEFLYDDLGSNEIFVYKHRLISDYRDM